MVSNIKRRQQQDPPPTKREMKMQTTLTKAALAIGRLAGAFVLIAPCQEI